MTTHGDNATAHLAATRAAIDEVDRLHEMRPHDRAGIAAGYDRVRQGFKFAEIHALLAIAEHLATNLAEVDRNARAYGFEVGRGHAPTAVLHASSDNPFVRSDS